MIAHHTPRSFLLFGMALALLAPMVACAGFGWFHVGYWNAEPIMLAMLMVAAMAAAWLGVGAAAGWLTWRFPAFAPCLGLWVIWMGWQWFMVAASPNPWRAWFGPPEQGEGAAWYLASGVLMLLLASLWQVVRFRAWLLGWMAALMLALACLHLVSDEGNNLLAGFFFASGREAVRGLLPFIWPDYLALMAAWWWIACQIAFPHVRLRVHLGWAGIMALVIFASSNRAALVLLTYAVVLSTAIRLIRAMPWGHFERVSTRWRCLAAAACLLPMGWLLAAPYLPVRYHADQSQSLPSRILMNHIGLTALAENPSRLLVGKGFGQFADDFFAHALIRDIQAYDGSHHSPNWPMVRGYNYHSHNMALEVLLALGVVGLVVWLLLPLVAIRQLPESLFWPVVPMLVAVTWLHYLWFSMPQAMAFAALGWMLIMRACGGGSPRRLAKWPVRVGLGASALALAWSAAAQWEAMRYSMNLRDPFGERGGVSLTRATMEEDIVRGGDRLRSFFIQTTKRMAAAGERVEPKHIALYGHYLHSMKTLAQNPATGAYNGAAVLYGYNALLYVFTDPQFGALRREAIADYPSMARLHTQRAPRREDSVAPFLDALWRYDGDTNHTQLMAVVHELMEIAPEHRSALWLAGSVLAEKTEFRAQGEAMMHEAETRGVNKVFPIPHSGAGEVKN